MPVIDNPRFTGELVAALGRVQHTLTDVSSVGDPIMTKIVLQEGMEQRINAPKGSPGKSKPVFSNIIRRLSPRCSSFTAHRPCCLVA